MEIPVYTKWENYITPDEMDIMEAFGNWENQQSVTEQRAHV